VPGAAPETLDSGVPRLGQAEAEYSLESPVKCPACGETVSTLKAIRLLRTQVNFISTLPRRGRVIVCPRCGVMVPAELTSF
jgi:hypothetical protein